MSVQYDFMGFILVPKNGKSVSVNAWNWRPTLELLFEAGLIDGESYEKMGTHGGAGEVDSEIACRISDFISAKLASMRQGERILADLTATDRPQKRVTFSPETPIDSIDAVDFYSATYEWLGIFRDFCKASGGFKVS